MKHFLTIKNITFAYKRKVPILKGISLSFEKGKITALLGNNGSGKTTLLRIIAGITQQNSGNLILNGVSVNKKNIIEYKKSIGYMPETLQMYPTMTTTDVLVFFARLRGIEVRNVSEVIDRVGLAPHAKKPTKDLSKGLKQRLNLAQAIIGRPKLIILDEPSNGFDYVGMHMFYKVIKRLASDGTLVIITTHLLSELSGNVDNVAVMKDGEIVKSGSMDEIYLENGSVQQNVVFCLDKNIESSQLSSLKQKYAHLVMLYPHVVSVDLPANRVDNLIVDVKEIGLNVSNLYFTKSVVEKTLEDCLV